MEKAKTLRTIQELNQAGLIQNTHLPLLEEVVNKFSLAITPQIQKLIEAENLINPNGPLAKQFVPSIQELNISKSEQLDPIGDEVHTKVKGIIHRYPDRCLLMPLTVCPVYCRFCFRREKVGPNSLEQGTLHPDELDKAIDYIQEHPEIWEVILTGGDPLLLSPHQLKKIIAKLSAIPHLDVIRIHTRVPLVDPSRINDDLLDSLKTPKALYVLLHTNHPEEFSSEGINSCAKIVGSGIPMLSQTVLLKGINDNIETLSQLMRLLVRHRIKPYYLHHPDLAKGTEHFRLTIEAGQQLMKQLRGRYSGLCQPTYVLDIPGGHGKVPIGPNYIQHHSCIEDYRGIAREYFPS